MPFKGRFILPSRKVNLVSAQHLPDQEERKGGRSPVCLVSTLWPWLLVACAWAVLMFATLTHQTFILDYHHLLQSSELPWLVSLAVFLLCWQVMTVAMMLPSSMPMIKLVMYAGQKQHRSIVVPLAFLAGYAVIWTGFALGAFLGDTLLHHLAGQWPWLVARPWLIGAMTFAVAGLFQFMPLKRRCLDACRTPLGFFLHYYRKGIEPAWRLGLRHGGFCLGCCWALMLVMFGVGIGSLAVMVALTGVMVIEKTMPGGERLSLLVGVVLLLLAGLWLAHPVWLRIAL
jgi:predicted metal-binding membrane protein